MSLNSGNYAPSPFLGPQDKSIPYQTYLDFSRSGVTVMIVAIGLVEGRDSGLAFDFGLEIPEEQAVTRAQIIISENAV